VEVGLIEEELDVVNGESRVADVEGLGVVSLLEVV